MRDGYGREIDYLRISVTDRCNLRCRYCMPAAGVEDIGHESILGFEEIECVVRVAAGLGFRKFRLTGGEPLVRRGITELVRRVARIADTVGADFAMTSNGTLLDTEADALRAAGLRRVNISMDSLRADRYREITRGGDIEAVKRGLAAARRAGFSPVRLNVVALRGFNDDEIFDFAEITKNEAIDVRFIERMPVGGLAAGADRLSVGEIERMLADFVPEVGAEKPASREVARYIRYPGAPGRVGLISPISAAFCGDCNKIRLTADGKIKTCLCTDSEWDLKPALADGEAAVAATLEAAIRAKEERHRIDAGGAGARRGMSRIGG